MPQDEMVLREQTMRRAHGVLTKHGANLAKVHVHANKGILTVSGELLREAGGKYNSNEISVIAAELSGIPDVHSTVWAVN
jgi:hypothetical protein